MTTMTKTIHQRAREEIERMQRGNGCEVRNDGLCHACAIKCPDGVAAICEEGKHEAAGCNPSVCVQQPVCRCEAKP